MSELAQWHWSKVSSYLRCGEAFRRSERGEYIPPGTALLCGSGTHKGNELDFVHKINTGELLPLDAVQDATRDAVNDIWNEEGARLLPDEQTIGVTEVRGQTVDKAVRLVSQYHSEVAPNITPAAVERPWVVNIPSQNVALGGKIDLDEAITPDLPTGRIRDWKTRKASPRVWTADRSIQLTMYAMAKSVLDGAIPQVALDFLIDLKKGPKVVVLESHRTERHFDTLMCHLEAAITSWRKGVFLPTNPDNWWCDPVYCGYFDTCKYTHHY